MSLEISCAELHEKLTKGEKIKLVDCREPSEWDIVRIEGAELIPMRQTPGHLEELKASAEPVVIYCHHGMRSLQVVNWLLSQGLENVRSLAGGIDQWTSEIDPSLPRY